MKNDFTSNSSKSAMKHLSPDSRDFSAARPRRQTMAFLRQFARAYSCSPALPPALGAFIAN